jgi:HAE1 family hydrophobic/amphiphilic exporter-1
VTVATIYCRLPELGGILSKWRGKTRRWSQFQVMVMARGILAQFPDVRSSVQLISNISSGGRNADLQFNLVGPDLQKLTGYAEHIIANLRTTNGLVDVDMTLANRKPELRVEIDREKASQFGLQIQDIADTLRHAGRRRNRRFVRENDDLYDVWLRADARDRTDPGGVGRCHAAIEQRHEHRTRADGELRAFQRSARAEPD